MARSQTEIDIMGEQDKNTALFGECKWTNEKVDGISGASFSSKAMKAAVIDALANVKEYSVRNNVTVEEILHRLLCCMKFVLEVDNLKECQIVPCFV